MTIPPSAPGQPPAPQVAPGQQAPPQQMPYGQPPASEPPRRLSAGVAILLFVVLPLIVLALIIGGSIAAVNAFRGTPVTETVDVEAGSSLFIDVPNAAIRLAVSDDDQIHILMRGTYSSTRPRLDVGASGDETEIRGGCPDSWFVFFPLNNCRVRIDVSLPPNLDVTASGRNGSIGAEDLTGSLDLSTTNGAIDVDGASGVLALHTTNGRIEVDDSTATDVQAQTTNGAVLLSFSDAPDLVTANSTNGEIRIVVPDDGTEYFVDANTTNGRIDTEDVPGDRRADRTIRAETTNGGVTVETSRRR
ncbi:MAG: DUF4097 family beta strand repeat-containing protein [Mycetocola sp.]